jgi:hypothetical protein
VLPSPAWLVARLEESARWLETYEQALSDDPLWAIHVAPAVPLMRTRLRRCRRVILARLEREALWRDTMLE